MKLTYKNNKLAIYDAVLSPDDFQSVWLQLQREDYKTPTRNDNWIKVWRLGDGPSVSSRDYRYSKRPFHNAFDLVLNALTELAKQHVELVGTEGQQWNDITLRSYIYPRGSKLSWHDDTYDAAFIYYAHPKWGSTWGGELMIAETAAFEHIKAEAPCGPYLDHEWEDRYLMGEGRGMFISAKPNRLVLSANGVYHAINRVDPDAGDHGRCTVAGFFMKPE